MPSGAGGGAGTGNPVLGRQPSRAGSSTERVDAGSLVPIGDERGNKHVAQVSPVAGGAGPSPAQDRARDAVQAVVHAGSAYTAGAAGAAGRVRSLAPS